MPYWHEEKVSNIKWYIICICCRNIALVRAVKGWWLALPKGMLDKLICFLLLSHQHETANHQYMHHHKRHFAIHRNPHKSVKWSVWLGFSHLCFCFIHLHFYRIRGIRSKCGVARVWVISNVWKWVWRQIRTEKYNITKAVLKTKQHIAHKILITLKVTAPWDLKIFQMKSTRLIFFWTKLKKENVHCIKSNLQNNVSRVGPALWPLSWGC